ncbi:DUF4160 domain-containing protein [Azotobacter salinestris]|uniref:DUF4160 domain-containing protein n=1 Tax=Azotobacter salinestris TaxID=69964 RepID=UPI0012669B63|nr:DUF4160 domain-containing protein [Azotobacter salinestris]
MATVRSDRNWKIKVYPDDHAPPHFHVQTPEGESLVEIDGLKVLGKGRRAQSPQGRFGVGGATCR